MTLHQATMVELASMAQYFGEDPRQENGEIFTVFADFVTKLEVNKF